MTSDQLWATLATDIGQRVMFPGGKTLMWPDLPDEVTAIAVARIPREVAREMLVLFGRPYNLQSGEARKIGSHVFLLQVGDRHIRAAFYLVTVNVEGD